MEVEQPETPTSNRKLVFISHANPQDNNEALWLASRLSLAGYSVWSDVTQLFGGEIFWDDIEDAIRNHTAKFIILVSRNSQNAPGVLDEVNLAITVERGQRLTRFVIPIRLDDLPFDQFRANIARKNAVDFSQDWADGLKNLLERLDRDKIPKDTPHSPNEITTWFSDHYSAPARVQEKPQFLGSNWIPISHMPQEVHFSRIPIGPPRAAELVKAFRFPAFLHEQFVGSFATSSELQPSMPSYLVLTYGHKVSTQHLLDGTSSDFPNLSFQDGQNMIAGLLRQAWDAEMQNRRLLSYQFSDRSNAWFYPHGFSTNDTVEYTDLDGTVRNKRLVGKSERLNAFWHFAVSVHPHFGRLTRLSFRTHLVFSLDGTTSLPSKERMHVMRRSFCRNWYNERWRGLLLAYLTCLSHNEEISLPVSPSHQVGVSKTPLRFKSLVSLEDSVIPYSEKTDEEFDLEIPEDREFDNAEDLNSEGPQIDEAQDEESEKR